MDRQYQCCWCSSKELSEVLKVEDPSELETNMRLLLELLELSPGLLVEHENVNYRLCMTCADLVSFGTRLKIQIELAFTTVTKDELKTQLVEVQHNLKSRTQNAFSLSRTVTSLKKEKFTLGTSLSRCFAECNVRLRPEDILSIDDNRLHYDKSESTNSVGRDFGNPGVNTGCQDVKFKVETPEEQNAPQIVDQLFECEGCSETFSTTEKKAEHERIHHLIHDGGKTSRSKYKCGYCEMIITCYFNLRRHRETHFKRSSVCIYCGKICASEDLLQEHIGTHVSLRFECVICKKKFRKSCDLVRHMRLHTGEKPYKCENCNASFVQKISLDKHKKYNCCVKDQDPSKLRFECEICVKKFGSRRSLINHQKVHKLYNCEICNISFALKSSIAQHNKVLHPDISVEDGHPSIRNSAAESSLLRNLLTIQRNRFEAKESSGHSTSLSLNNKDELRNPDPEQNHVGGHHNIKVEDCETNSADQVAEPMSFNDEPVNEQDSSLKEEYECAGCQKVFTTLKAKHAHEMSHLVAQSAGRNYYRCGFCAVTVCTISNLKRHRLAHLRRSFVCKFCGKVCETQNSLEKHIGSHTTFECEICTKEFSCNYQMVRHTKTHTAEKVFGCEICSKKFTEKFRLVRHRKTHTEEKAFKCKICSKSFSQNVLLAEHRVMGHCMDVSATSLNEANTCSDPLTFEPELNVHKLANKFQGIARSVLLENPNDDSDVSHAAFEYVSIDKIIDSV